MSRLTIMQQKARLKRAQSGDPEFELDDEEFEAIEKSIEDYEEYMAEEAILDDKYGPLTNSY